MLASPGRRGTSRCRRRLGAWRKPAAGLLALVLAATLAACGDGAGSADARPSGGSGPVDVLYAGSLVHMVQDDLGPAFTRSAGYAFDGFAAGSEALASEIRGGVRQGDVFVSASPTVNATLQGPSHGSWVSWYATFATSPLVLGYNPHSRFASRLRTEPWYRVVTAPGFLLGRTDPATDPKGKLAVDVLDRAAAAHEDPALRHLVASTSGVFPEETLVGRLQAGQLDAGFFYRGEAVAAGIPTVALTGFRLAARYTVAVLERAPHPQAARAFVRFLLGPTGRAILRRNGFPPVQPPVVTDPGRVPGDLRAVLHLT